VIEAAVVDAHRRLILIRRDNTEHLMMIGGRNDLVIEANIASAATPREAEAPSPASGATLSAFDEPSEQRPDPEPARREPPPPLPTPRLAEQTLRPGAPEWPQQAPLPPSPPIQRNPQEPDERLARVADILARPHRATQASELRAPRRQMPPTPPPRQRMLPSQPTQSPTAPPRVPGRTSEISEE
jgi:hypothetical protein